MYIFKALVTPRSASAIKKEVPRRVGDHSSRRGTLPWARSRCGPRLVFVMWFQLAASTQPRKGRITLQLGKFGNFCQIAILQFGKFGNF